ncbi:MAG: M28 family peptidase [Anaerolineales bacterium]|nr:M28 family peptidase [Anaerolineales bacterium]MCB9126676.1 M28 family peptidase [Ardenticatenales bacterium]MCB9171784.1 M28 family peptidase [Ardenticatenales bacterium]
MAHPRLSTFFALLFVVLLVACNGAQPTPRAATPNAPATVTTTATVAPPAASPTPEAVRFNGEAALALANEQCEIGPRPTGSDALLLTRDWIGRRLEGLGWRIIHHDSEYEGVPIHNIIGVKGDGPARMVGAHFDTRPVADMDPNQPDQPIIGANDGASGVAVLLELARTLDVPEGQQVQLAFFDAEDRGRLDGWPFSVGSAHLVRDLDQLDMARPDAMVLLDMIGDADLQIYRERNSAPELNDVIFGIANELGYVGDGFYDEPKWTIIDDHLPFLEAGIPAVDLIDFDYPYWHTVDDTCDKLSADSLQKVGDVVELWIEEWR